MIRLPVQKYISSHFDARKVPKNKEAYQTWCDELYEARGQLGLINEESAVLANIDWTDDAEGMRSTKILVLII